MFGSDGFHCPEVGGNGSLDLAEEPYVSRVTRLNRSMTLSVSVRKRGRIDLTVVENLSIDSEGKPSPFAQKRSLRDLKSSSII